MRGRTDYKINQTVKFSNLSDIEKEEIFSSAVKVLERTGANIYDEEALELLSNAGCWIKDNRVRFPAGLTEWATKVAPSKITIYDRNGKPAMYLEGNNVYYGPGPSNNNHLDPFTGKRRSPTKKDKSDIARVCDYLEHIDFVMDLGTPSDVTGALADLHAFDAMVRNTTKPIVHWGYDIEKYQYIVDIASVIAGGLENLQSKPFIALYSEPSSPLQHSKEAMSKAIFCAKKRLPVVYTPGVMSGATGPVTPAATLVIGIAESLVGLVVSQLINQGSPFIMGGVYYIMDMKSTLPSFGSPEFNTMQSAIAEIAHHIGVPIFGTAGCTDSCLVDGQAAAEAAMNVLTAAQSGAQLVHDVGYIESGMTGSIEQTVLGNEIIAVVRRFMEGIKVNKDTLATDLIDKVGPGGNYREEEHTKNYYNREVWKSDLFERKDFNEKSSTTMKERIRMKTRQIIQEHKPESLSSDTLKQIDEIIKKAEKSELQNPI